MDTRLDEVRTGTGHEAMPPTLIVRVGYVEATRDDDAEKNRICPASCLPDTPTSFARMQVLGNRAAQAFTAQPDIKEWAGRTTLNPARIPPERGDDPKVVAALDRYRSHAVAGLARLAEFAAMP